MANDLIPSKKPSFWDRFKRRDRSEATDLKQLFDSVEKLTEKLSEDGEIGRVLKELNKTLERMDVALKTIEARDERGVSRSTPERLNEAGAYKKIVVMLSEEIESIISQLQETSAVTGINSSKDQAEYIAIFKSMIYAILSCYINREGSTLIPESKEMYNQYIKDGVYELGEIGEYSFICTMFEHFGIKNKGKDVNLYSKGRDTLGIPVIEWIFGNYSPLEPLPIKPEELDKLLKRAMSEDFTLGTEGEWLERMQEVQPKSKTPEERRERLHFIVGMLGLAGKPHTPYVQTQIEAQSQVAPGI